MLLNIHVIKMLFVNFVPDCSEAIWEDVNSKFLEGGMPPDPLSRHAHISHAAIILLPSCFSPHLKILYETLGGGHPFQLKLTNGNNYSIFRYTYYMLQLGLQYRTTGRALNLKAYPKLDCCVNTALIRRHLTKHCSQCWLSLAMASRSLLKASVQSCELCRALRQQISSWRLFHCYLASW